MTRSPPRPAQRLAAAAILLLVPVALWLAAIRPLTVPYAEARADLAESRQRLTRYRDIAAASDAIGVAIADARAEQVAGGAFLVGETDALAAAALQDMIGAIAADADSDVRSVQSLPAQAENGLVRIRLRAQLVTTTAGLVALLEAIETGRPLLFVDDFKLRTRIERARPDGDSLDVASEYLIDLALSGYRVEAAP